LDASSITVTLRCITLQTEVSLNTATSGVPLNLSSESARKRASSVALIASCALFGAGVGDAQAKEKKAALRSDADKAYCDAEFLKIVGDDIYAGSPTRVSAWKALAPRCDGTGLYESRLVGFLIYNGDLAEARTTGLAALDRPFESKRELLVALSELESRAGNVGLSINYSQRAIEADKSWYGGYASLGETYLAQRRYDEAIAAFEQSYDRDPNANIAAVLSIAYCGAQRYLDSAKAMQKALRTDISTLRHTKAVSAAAYSLVQIDQVAAAKDLLAKHAELVPAARQDPDFGGAVKVVADALRAAKAK
jgi:tetratricopeptide (TPR) repeat protein